MASLRRVRRTITDGAFTTFCWLATGVALFALGLILWSLVTQGIGGLNLDVFTRPTEPSGSPGGLLNAIVGSIITCALAMIMAVIVGVPTVASMTVSALPGESVAGFRVSVVTRPPGKPQQNVNEELVVMGAGRVEVGLVSESVGTPVSASLEVTELRGLESRLRVVATS